MPDSFVEELELDESFGRDDLSRQLALLTGMIENTDEVAIAADLEGRVLYMNPAAARRCGCAEADVASLEIGDLIRLDERQLAQIKTRVRDGRSMTFETRMRRRSRDEQPVQVSVSPLRADSVIRGMVVFATDITQRKQTEAALSRLMRLQQLITDLSARFINLPTGDTDHAIDEALAEIGRFVEADRSYVFRIHDGGLTIDNSHEWCADGIAPQIDRLQGLPLADFPIVARALEAEEVLYVPDVAELPEGSAERQEFELEGIRSLLTVAMTLGGETRGFIGFDAVRRMTRWSDDTIALLKTLGDIVASALDRQRSEAALQQNEARYRQVIENTNDGVAVYRAVDDGEDFVFVEFNHSAEKMERVTAEEVIGRRVTEVFPGVKNLGLLEVFRQVWRTGEPANQPVHLYQDGRLTGWRRNYVYKLPGGEVVAMYSDETQHKLAEEKIRTSEEKFRSVVESSPLGMLMFDLREDGRLVFLEGNPAAHELLGADLPAAVGRPIEEGFPDLAASDIPEAFRRIALEGGAYHADAFAYRDLGGEERFYEVRAFQTSPGHMAATIRDVTERLQLEEQLRQATKMEAIGQLAGGVAHDFNNQLTVIRGYCDLLADGPSEGLTVEEAVGEIQKAAARSGRLTHQLLAFSRRQMLRPDVLDLNEIVSEMSNPLSRMIGEDIELSVVLGEGVGTVWADRSQIEQTVMNLVVNARDAMPQGGALVIETGTALLGEEYVRAHPEIEKGPHVMLAVSDTGTGMDEETRRRVFDPFFTTKGVGKGTGLGLSMVYGFVKQSGGSIYVYSEPGQGSTFKIYLPLTVAGAEIRPAVVGMAGDLRGGETLLVVEDDEAVRQFMVRALRGAGYTVLEAGRASEALPLGEHYEGDIAMIITDVVMPGMRGPDLAARLVATRPRLGVLYISGYTQNAVVHHGELDPDVDLLTKPFTSEQLLLAIRRVLDDRSGSVGLRRSRGGGSFSGKGA
jgi:PAS domain S-box-containing protein